MKLLFYELTDMKQTLIVMWSQNRNVLVETAFKSVKPFLISVHKRTGKQTKILKMIFLSFIALIKLPFISFTLYIFH